MIGERTRSRADLSSPVRRRLLIRLDPDIVSALVLDLQDVLALVERPAVPGCGSGAPQQRFTVRQHIS